jgi:DnaJ-domain-containing protein 1
MSLHDTWAAAKKQAWKQFKEAQKNYLKEQDKKIEATNDAKARKKALDAVLGEAGLDKGESLDDYLKFADGFGKQLDALEKAIDNNNKLRAKYNFQGDLDNLLKNKDAAKQFLLVCQRTYNTALITFYMKDYKNSPQEVWDQYVKSGAKDQLDLSTDPGLEDDWKNAARDPQTLARQGKGLIDRLRSHVKHELERDVVMKLVGDAAAMKALGFVPKATIEDLKKEVRETAKKYNGQIDRAVKKWKNLKPQFWQPLDEALQEIVRYVDQH